MARISWSIRYPGECDPVVARSADCTSIACPERADDLRGCATSLFDAAPGPPGRGNCPKQFVIAKYLCQPCRRLQSRMGVVRGVVSLQLRCSGRICRCPV